MKEESYSEEQTVTQGEKPSGETVEDLQQEGAEEELSQGDTPEEESSSLETSVEQEEINRLTKEIEEWKNRSLRAQADLENVRRRSKEEKEKAAKYRAQSLIESLLPVLDNFERAINISPGSDEVSSLLEGVKMVYSQFEEALQKEGIEVIETEGKMFDPNLHQAVMQVEEPEYESNQIVEELQRGYMLKDRVIRPAMVKVNA